MTGSLRRLHLPLGLAWLAACSPAPGRAPEPMSISIVRDYHLVATGLEPRRAFSLPAGSRELRLWPFGWDRRWLLRATQAPEAGTVLEWWRIARGARNENAEGAWYSENEDLAAMDCVTLRRTDAGSACLVRRVEGDSARSILARLDSLRGAIVAVSPPNRIHLDGYGLEVEGREGVHYFTYRLRGRELESDSAAMQLYRWPQQPPPRAGVSPSR